MNNMIIIDSIMINISKIKSLLLKGCSYKQNVSLCKPPVFKFNKFLRSLLGLYRCLMESRISDVSERGVFVT